MVRLIDDNGEQFFWQPKRCCDLRANEYTGLKHRAADDAAIALRKWLSDRS
jgi:hypothetical protein